MASKTAFEACDFTGATELAPINSPANTMGEASYYLPCPTPGSVLYVGCSVSTHCSMGQKLEVQVSATERVVDKSTSPATALLHSDSLQRVMTLLGYRVDSTTGYTYIERGYQTEAAAEISLEMIWCLEAHCPSSAHDFEPGASKESCLATVYNLGGFVSRKRPTPKLAVAEGYYLTALTHHPTHCATLGYLTELYLMRSNASAAIRTASRLCGACGFDSTISAQIKVAFDTTYPGVASWPCSAPSPPTQPPAWSPTPALPPPLQPGQSLVHIVVTRLTIAGTLAEFDSAAFKKSFAEASGVSEAQVALDLSAGSVVVVATVTTTTAEKATAVAKTLAVVTADPSAATAAFGVTVEKIEAPVVSTAVPVTDESQAAMQAASQQSTGLLIGLIGGGVVLALLVLACWYRRRRGRTSAAETRGSQRTAPGTKPRSEKNVESTDPLGLPPSAAPSTVQHRKQGMATREGGITAGYPKGHEGEEEVATLGPLKWNPKRLSSKSQLDSNYDIAGTPSTATVVTAAMTSQAPPPRHAFSAYSPSAAP